MFGTNKQQKVTLNGQELEVRNLEVTYSVGDLPSVFIEGFLNPSRNYEATVELTAESSTAEVLQKMIDEAAMGGNRAAYDLARKGDDRSVEITWGGKRIENIKEISIEMDKTMGYPRDEYCAEEKSCGDNGSYGAHNLAKKFVDLSLDERQKLIRKYDLKQEDGTLTARGRELLLTILFDTYEDEVIEALESLEEERKENTSSCGC